MEISWFILVTVSACAGFRIPANAVRDDPLFVAPMQPPVWQGYAQNKIAHFQQHLKHTPPTEGLCSHPSTSLSTVPQKHNQDHLRERVKVVIEKVLQVRKATGKTVNIAEATPESLRSLPQLLQTDPPQTSKDCEVICPAEEEFLPCQCDDCNKSINCSGVTSLDQLQQLFQTVNFPIHSYKTFFMHYPEFSSTQNQSVLPDNIFGDISFEIIDIGNTKIEHIMDNAFSGSEETLKEIILQSNQNLTYFPFNQLKNFGNLGGLEITGSSITTLPILNLVPNLYKVLLNQNDISEMSPMAFADLPALQVLDLAFNKIEDIKATALQFSAPNVYVYLDNNRIQSIDDMAFSGKQPALLDVSSNCLDALDEHVFTPILDTIIENDYDTFVRAEDNPLQCNNILWLLQNPTYLMYFFLPENNCSL